MPVPARDDRRRFLKNASVAAAAASSMPYWSTARADQTASGGDRPRFALIGAGGRANGLMKQALDVEGNGKPREGGSGPLGDFVAVADVDLRHANEFAGKYAQEGRDVAVYQDYRELLDRNDVDAVICGTVDHWHARVSIDAMRSGRDVYCEKPLTLTIAEGQQILKVLEETGRVFQVGTQQRSECRQRFLKAIAVVRAGRVGDVRRVTCGINASPSSPALPVADVPAEFDWDAWLGQCPWEPYRFQQADASTKNSRGFYAPLTNGHKAFRWFYQFSGGKLTDWGAHHVDIAQWLIGENGVDRGVRKITPLVVEHPVPFDEDGNPTVTDRYNTATKFELKADFPGVEMIIKSSGDNGILVEGTKGRIFVNRGKLVGKPIEDLEANPLPEGAVEEIYGGPVPKNHMTNFFDCVKSRETPISDVQSHHRAMTTCHLAGIACRLNRAIEWDPVAEKVIGDPQAQSMTAREQRDGYAIEV